MSAIAAVVAFKTLSLCSYALRETMVPLPETVFEIVFTSNVTLSWMSLMSANLYPFRALF
jgi:hypothetical protein